MSSFDLWVDVYYFQVVAENVSSNTISKSSRAPDITTSLWRTLPDSKPGIFDKTQAANQNSLNVPEDIIVARSQSNPEAFSALSDPSPIHSLFASPRSNAPSEQFFICDICGDVYSNKYNMMVHKRGIHENRQIPCECGKVFRWKQTLKKHKDKCPYVQSRK